MPHHQDDEDVTVVTIIAFSGSAQEVSIVSDQAKTSGFSAFLRPAAMAVVMAGAAGLGAAGAIYLQSGKSLKVEENHAEVRDDSHAEANDRKAAPPKDLQTPTLPDSEFGEFAVAQQSTERHDQDHDHLIASKPLTADHTADSSHDHGLTSESIEEHPAAANTEDPFSEESLGFDHGFPAPEIDEKGSVHDHESQVDADDGTLLTSENALTEKHKDPPAAEHEPLPTTADSRVHHGVADQLSGVEHHRSDSHAERSAVSRKQKTKELASAESLGIVRATRQEKMTQQAVNLMAIADEDLAGGNYVQAMQAYQTLRKKSDGVPGVAILFRLALCAEAAGRHAAAIEAYRKISGTQADPAWAGVARYGEARCLSATKRHEGLQTDLLRRAILDETEFLPTVRGEVLHLIGRDLWREQTSITSTDLLDDQTLIVPEWAADPARLLDELPMLIHETPTKFGRVEFQVLNLTEASPGETMVRLNCGMTRSETLLRNLINGCELKCDVTAAAVETLQGRTQQVHVTEQSLALLLDGITISSGVAWQLKGNVVQILHVEEMTPVELRQSRFDAAERILRTAVMEVPGSPQAGHSRLALSTLLFEQKRAADALQFLQVQIESSPRSVVETEAAFNLGKCLMILNQRDEAVQAFLRSIDSSGGLIDVKIASYIFHSRMLLEDNYGKMAVQSMMRGLSLSEGSAIEPFAALHLASLYLMLGNPQGANTVLMERRDKLMDGPGREGAAFLSALSRFRAAVLADRREREGATVVSALTELDPANYCGGHWAVLVAGACEELGLSQESTDAYGLALRKLPPSDLRNKTVLRLAAHYQAENEPEQARLLLTSLSSIEADQLAIQAKLRSAELSLEQKHPDEAIAACRQLIATTEASQIERAALRIMGKAFEMKKDHQAAIYCFAGMIPEEVNDNKSTAGPKHSPTTGGHN